VSNIPGLKAKNKTVVTMRSVRVSTRPMAFAVHEKEHECVEKNRGSTSESITELDTGTIGAEQDTWAEREEQGGWDRNLLWKHVYFVYIL
jgi:hypothetical protein